MRTLLLDRSSWDLVIDASANIAVASPPYAVAQDCASACRTFLAEVYYDTTLGVPYWQQILGQYPPAALMKAKWIAACMLVPEVDAVVAFLTGFVNRALTGQLQITSTGEDQVTQIINIIPPGFIPLPQHGFDSGFSEGFG